METIFGSTISDKNSCQNCFFCFKIIKNVSFDYKRTGGYLRRETEENQWKTQSVYFLWPHQWRQPYESYIIWKLFIWCFRTSVHLTQVTWVRLDRSSAPEQKEQNPGNGSRAPLEKCWSSTKKFRKSPISVVFDPCHWGELILENCRCKKYSESRLLSCPKNC